MISILKITKGNNSAKRYNFHTSHIQNYEVAYNRKKCRRSNSSQSKYGHTFIWTKFREIISNAIKVIERTQYLCWILKRGIIQQIMLVE